MSELSGSAGPATGNEGARPPKIIGFVCDWSVALADAMTDDGRLRALPNVHIIMVPCSGFMRPQWVELALKQGADGAFVCGCPYGDCLNREGNYLIRDRMLQMRRRLQRQRVDPDRMAMLAYGFHDGEAFLAAVREFAERVRAIGSPVPSARAPASGGS